jgi:hypothetical protein
VVAPQNAVANTQNSTYVYNFPGTYAAGMYKVTAKLYKLGAFIGQGPQLVKTADGQTTIP